MSTPAPSSARAQPIADLSQHAEPFVTVRTLARYWGVDRKTVYRAIQKGALPAFRLPGGAIRIRRDDAVAYEAPEPQ